MSYFSFSQTACLDFISLTDEAPVCHIMHVFVLLSDLPQRAWRSHNEFDLAAAWLEKEGKMRRTHLCVRTLGLPEMINTPWAEGRGPGASAPSWTKPPSWAAAARAWLAHTSLSEHQGRPEVCSMRGAVRCTAVKGHWAAASVQPSCSNRSSTTFAARLFHAQPVFVQIRGLF